MIKLSVVSAGSLVGGLLALCISSNALADQANGTFENYSKIKPSRVAGETLETLNSYKRSCPECVLVARDVAKMRVQNCKTAATEDSVIAGDPIYAYLNGIRMVLSTRGGYSSPLYTSARQIVEKNVDCQNSDSWIERSQKVLTQTFNNGQPLS